MYRQEFSPLRSLTSWLPRLLVAGSIALGACDAGDTTAPSAADPAISPAKVPTGQACVGCPVVSSHILVAAWRGSRRNDIYSMNPDGTGKQPIVTTKADEVDPAWSPNYTKLVFSRSSTISGSTLNGLWTMGWDGSQEFRVTQDSGDRGADWGKTNRIVFYSTRETLASGTNEIFTINPDGTGVTRLTNDVADDRNPAWSPDGSKIVFASNRGGRRGVGSVMHLYVMNADGTGVTQLTFGQGEDQPAWSPDGTQIAYAAVVGTTPTDLWVMNANGTNAKLLVAGFVPAPNGWVEQHPGQPSWSPDSKKIAYASDLTGQYQVYSIGAAGGAILKLTTLGQEQMPAWSN
jgi:Tol biopolymer transport system component